MPDLRPPSIAARLSQANQLIQRLERISADSVWAHRSSGYRGSLLKWIEIAEMAEKDRSTLSQTESEHFDQLMEIGLRLLENAAREKIRRRGFQR